MPELTIAEIEKAIIDGRLTLLSIDTSIFSQYHNRLEHGLLQRLSQFEASDVDLVLSDVVVREVHRHMVEAAVEADNALKKAMRLSGAARNLDIAAFDPVVTAVTLGETAEQCVSRRMADFQTRTGHKLAVTSDLVSAGDLFTSYFDVKPPFEIKESKKFEFPDAMALQGLEGFARNSGKLMLVVSADGGWRDFCKQSDWLVHEPKLGAGMSRFQKVPSVVSAALAKQITDGNVGHLSSAIERELIDFVDGMEIHPEASAWYTYDYDIEEREYLGFEFRDGPTLKLVDHDADEELFVFETIVDLDISVSCSFTFHVRDEGDYITVGGTYATTTGTQRVSLAITICGDPNAEFDVVEVEVIDYDSSVDFGQVDPDYDDEPYHD